MKRKKVFFYKKGVFFYWEKFFEPQIPQITLIFKQLQIKQIARKL